MLCEAINLYNLHNRHFLLAMTMTIFMLLIPNQAFAKITEVADLVVPQEVLRKVNKDTLVIFDVDHVLMMPKDEYSLSKNPYRKQLWQQLKKKLSKKEIDLLYSIITLDAKWNLVDPEVIGIMANLKERHVPTVALSSFSTGKFGIIEKREDIRIRDMNSLGISFLGLSPFKENIELHELAGEDGMPMVKDGVILTAEIDKGLVLEQILLHQNYLPKAIIFIDDQLSNLQSVEKLCARLKIDFQGFHYIAVSLIPPSSFNKEAEDLRFKTLEKEHRWMVD